MDKRQYMKEWRKTPAGKREKLKAVFRSAAWNREHKNRRREICRLSAIKTARPIKIEVFSHYGKNKRPLCSWRGCAVDDLDLLTLDHVEDDGAKHRKKLEHRGGINFYKQLRRWGFPKGFQVLCWNHQWKKEILRRRKNRK